MANPARAYLATQVETTSQGELLIMLYDAAIKFLKRAQMEIDSKDYAKKGIYISKAMAIIHELAECLNKEKGGEITPKLSQLYMFCTSQLIKANIRLDKKMIDEVIKILDGLRSAYAQIVPMHEGNGAQAAAPVQPAQTPQAPTPDAAEPAQPAAQNGYGAPKAAPQPPSQNTPEAQTAREQLAGYAPPVQPPLETVPPKQEAETAPPEQAQPESETEPTQPAKPTPRQPPKLRTAFNAAKFRAANAYSNNNS